MTQKTKKMTKKKFIEVEPITFIIGLSIYAITVWTLLDWTETILVTISLLAYGYSISYGSKTYKKYLESNDTKQ